jgi:putative LysE/RhtB family amino acid efflux pump
MWYVLQAFGFGLVFAVASESLAVLCLRHTLQQGFKAGFASGLGVAAADGLFSALVLLGLTGISGTMIHYQRWLSLGGGLLLLWFGWKCFTASVNLADGKIARLSYLNYFTSCFVLCVAHPMSIVVYTSVFLPIAEGATVGIKKLMVAGAFSGSLLWWAILSAIGRKLQVKLIESKIKLISRICGCVLVARGLWMLKMAGGL